MLPCSLGLHKLAHYHAQSFPDCQSATRPAKGVKSRLILVLSLKLERQST
jgi:hypothetical protein